MLTITAQAVAATSGQVAGALVTGIVLFAVGVANVVVTVRQGRATRKATKNLADREQWWNRFTWAAEELFSSNERRALVAVSVLNALAAVEWIHQDDQEMIINVFDQLNADYYEQGAEATQDV